MIRARVAVVLIASLTACGSVGADTAAGSTSASAGTRLPLPFAPPPPSMPDEGVICAADVKLCPDTRTVSRNLAQACAFDPCPGPNQ